MGRNHRRVLNSLGHDVVTVDPVVHGADWVAIPPGRFDAAVVATPPRYLAEETCRLVARGVPVLVEKPCGSTPADVALIDDWARERDVFVAADYTERFNPVIPHVRDAIGAGVDLLTTVRVGPERIDANIHIDLLCHDLDLHLELCPDARHIPVVAYHPKKLRTLAAHCADGIVQADLIARTVNGRQCDGPEPLISVWRDFMARRGSGYASLEREALVLRRALWHRDREAA